MKHPIKLNLSLDDPLGCYSIDESVEIIRQIHLQLESLEDYRLKLKWCMGQVLVHTHTPKGRRAQTVDEVGRRLRDECGIRASKFVLYQCVKLYTALNGDYERFVRWIEMKKRTLGRPVFWYDVINDLLGGKNNPAVIGREAADQANPGFQTRLFCTPKGGASQYVLIARPLSPIPRSGTSRKSQHRRWTPRAGGPGCTSEPAIQGRLLRAGHLGRTSRTSRPGPVIQDQSSRMDSQIQSSRTSTQPNGDEGEFASR